MDDVILRVISCLQEAGLEAARAFAPHPMRHLTAPRAAVELQSVRAAAGSFYDYLGEEEDAEKGFVERYGRRLGGTVLVRLSAPTAKEASAAAESAVAALTAGVQDVTVEEVSMLEPVFDPVADCHTRDVTLAFSAYFCALKTEDDGVFLDFKLEGRWN